MAAPAETNAAPASAAASAAAAAAAAANLLTFNDASSFDKLTNCRTMDLPMGPVELHVFKKDPPPELIERFASSLAEKHAISKEYITYFPDDKSLLYMDAPVSIPICILPPRAVLHRFDKEGARDPSKNVPIFFGNKKSVSFYSGKTSAAEINATRSSYRLKRPARLLHMCADSLPLIEQLQLTPEESEFLQVYYRMGKLTNSDDEVVNTPIILPAAPYGTFEEIHRGGRLIPFNRKFAEIVCRLGFDGWVVKPLNPNKKEGMLQITGGIPQVRAPDGTVVTLDKLATIPPEQRPQARMVAPLNGNVSAMPPEIVICRWDVFMDRIAGGSRRRQGQGRRSTKHQSRRNPRH